MWINFLATNAYVIPAGPELPVKSTLTNVLASHAVITANVLMELMTLPVPVNPVIPVNSVNTRSTTALPTLALTVALALISLKVSYASVDQVLLACSAKLKSMSVLVTRAALWEPNVASI